MKITDYAAIIGYAVIGGCAVLGLRSILEQLSALKLRARYARYLNEREGLDDD